MKLLLSAGVSLLFLAGCNSVTKDYRDELKTEMPTPIYKKRQNDLVNLQAPEGDQIPVAVYKFGDLTGQRKANDRFADLSTAVSQGSEVFMIKALQDAGQGKWFRVVERVNLDNLVKERQLIRSQRELYEGKEAKPLQPLIVAGIMIDGGIVGYDSNVASGGVGARALGIGLSQQYRKDEVTVIVRLISINTGEVLLSTGVSKTVLSAGINGNVIKFLDQNTTSVEFEAGNNVNEPTTYAIRIAIEEAVVQIVREGIKRKLWSFKEEEKR